MSLKYAYCRISTKDQNIDRQIIAVKQFAPDISDNNIFVDKKTGKDFEREQYQEMKVILEHISKASLKNKPIELIVEELDRLGRNADLIKKELIGLSTLFQTNFFRLFFRYCTGVWYPKEECMRWWLYQFT